MPIEPIGNWQSAIENYTAGELHLTPDELKQRTKTFAVNVIAFCAALPDKTAYQIAAKQLMRSATSVGANYRAACRGKSQADFIAKLGIVEEEADESLYWLELLEEMDPDLKPKLLPLKDEASQLVAIFVSSRKTAKQHRF